MYANVQKDQYTLRKRRRNKNNNIAMPIKFIKESRRTRF
jgi:hypothetical protein